MTDVSAAGFGGRVLVVAPHMDDETLGCGLLLGGHPDKSQVHVAFVTDGAGAPERPAGVPEQGARIARLREQEAREALAVFGVPAGNIEFLGFEDGAPAGPTGCAAGEAGRAHPAPRSRPRVRALPLRRSPGPPRDQPRRLRGAARRPHRGAGRRVLRLQPMAAPACRRRAHVPDPAALRRLQPTAELARLKRRALECHRTQTTMYFDWQSRAVLGPEVLERVCGEPETYLLHDPSRPGPRAFARSGHWIAFVHCIEPPLKRWKDQWAARLAG
jgi:LmbE family N-acetylglucosaminyl deacetylase